MLIIFLYLVTLFIAPQLWIEPFVGVRVDYYVYPAWLLAAVLARRPLLPLTPADYIFLAMVLWIALSPLVNPSNPRSTDIIINYGKWLLLYKLVVASVGTIEQLRKVGWMLVFFALLLAIEGIQHKWSPDGLGWAGQTLGWIDPTAAARGEPGRTRWINIFDGPGVFCVAYTVALPFVLQYLNAPYAWFKRLLAAGLLVAPLMVAIYYTGSRGGLLTTLAILGCHFALRWGIGPLRIAITGFGLFVAFMVAPDYMTTFEDQSRSASHRVEMWGEGVEMTQQNPVFGIGKGNFAAYTSKLIAHNSAIEIMGETGMVGLFLWLALIYLSFKGIANYLRETENLSERAPVIALALSVVGYLVSAMFVTLEYETFYFLLGLCAVPGKIAKRPLEFTRKDFVYVSVAAIAWFAFVKLFVMAYFG